MSDQRPAGSRIYRCEGVVLQGIDFGESDRILTIYTRENGKTSVIAKGIRKPTNRLGYGLDHLSRVRLMLAQGRTLDVVTSVELVDAHLELAGNMRAYAYSSHLAELVNRLTQDNQENRRVYELLTGAIRVISDGVDGFSVARYFELSLFSLLGYRIELYRCMECGRDLQAEPNAFSFRYGGFLCPVCRELDRSAQTLSLSAQKYLRLLDRGGLEQTIRRELTGELGQEIERTMVGYARFHAEHDFSCLAVLRSLDSTTDRIDLSR